MRLAFLRIGGCLKVCAEEQGSNNAAILDHYLMKGLCENGHSILLAQYLCRGGEKSFVNELEEAKKKYPWYENVTVDETSLEIPSDVDMVIILQGGYFMRIWDSKLGANTNLILYKKLRNYKGPVVYICYDAYLPFNFIPDPISPALSICGASAFELFKDKTWMVINVGKDVQQVMELNNVPGAYYKDLGIDVRHIEFHFMLHELLDWGFEVREDYKKEVMYIGRLRTEGGRDVRLYNYMKLIKETSELQPVIYGKWKIPPEMTSYIDYRGTLPAGSDNVMRSYNSGYASILVPTPGYSDCGQLTVRIFEVIGSRTLPLIDSDWSKAMIPLLGEELWNVLAVTPQNIVEKLNYLPHQRRNIINYAYKQAKANAQKYTPIKDLNEILLEMRAKYEKDGAPDYTAKIFQALEIAKERAIQSKKLRRIKINDNIYNNFNARYDKNGNFITPRPELGEPLKNSFLFYKNGITGEDALKNNEELFKKLMGTN